MRAVATKFFQKLDDLRDLVLAQDRELEREGIAMRVQFILMLLRDQKEHDEEERKQGRRHLQPRKRRVCRTLADRRQENR